MCSVHTDGTASSSELELDTHTLAATRSKKQRSSSHRRRPHAPEKSRRSPPARPSPNKRSEMLNGLVAQVEAMGLKAAETAEAILEVVEKNPEPQWT